MINTIAFSIDLKSKHEQHTPCVFVYKELQFLLQLECSFSPRGVIALFGDGEQSCSRSCSLTQVRRKIFSPVQACWFLYKSFSLIKIFLVEEVIYICTVQESLFHTINRNIIEATTTLEFLVLLICYISIGEIFEKEYKRNFNAHENNNLKHNLNALHHRLLRLIKKKMLYLLEFLGHRQYSNLCCCYPLQLHFYPTSIHCLRKAGQKLISCWTNLQEE